MNQIYLFDIDESKAVNHLLKDNDIPSPHKKEAKKIKTLKELQEFIETLQQSEKVVSRLFRTFDPGLCPSE